MPPAIRLAKLRKIHTERAPEIIRVVTDSATPMRQKRIIYACLNNLCQLSAHIFSDLSATPGNHDLLEQAAELDDALLHLRSLVGTHIPTRAQLAA